MPTAYAPVRVLVAGAGAFGTGASRSGSPGAQTRKWLASPTPDPAALELIRSRHGVVNCLADPSRLIDEVEADAIVIATPAASHVEICVRALGRNLCALLEKPVAPSAAAAAPLLASARTPEASSCLAMCCDFRGIMSG